jgi:predicted Zn-dependent protease
MKSFLRRFQARLLVLVLLVPVVPALSAQEKDRVDTSAEPGWNLFSVKQDVELGRQSAAEIERQVRLLRDARVEKYVNAVLARLTKVAPGARYPYRARVIDAREINAAALPGGFLYVNRGLIEAARSEAELAGVLGHEVAHVALRHGTQQASKAYAAQAGLGLIGRLLGRGRENREALIEAIGGLGLDAAFLKFSRNDEYQADHVGLRLVNEAGYDPEAMATFFDKLREEARRDPGRLEQFLSSHPAPGDRAARLRADLGQIDRAPRRSAVGDFEAIRAQLRRLPAPADRAARGTPLAPGPPEASLRARQGEGGEP